MSPLHWAIEKGFNNIAELLLEHGANCNTTSKFLKTPYSIAKEKGNSYILNMMDHITSSDVKTERAHNLNSQLSFSKPMQGGEEIPALESPRLPTMKRERIHSYDAIDLKRTKTSLKDPKNLTLQLLQEQMSMMSGADDNLIQSALQSGRKIILTEAGKRLLNDSNLNKFLKIPLNTTISSSASGSASSKKSVSPRSSTVTSRRMSDTSDVLEIFRDTAAGGSGAKRLKPDILNIIRSSSDLQEVTITQRSKTSPAPSPTQLTSVSLSAINVPKAPQGQLNAKNKNQLPSSPDAIADFTQPEASSRQFSELSNNYNQLKRAFEREQQKNASLQRQMKQLEISFEVFKRQQNEKFDSILKLLTGSQRRPTNEDDGELVEEIL